MYNKAFEVLSWAALLFIVLDVNLLKSTVMVKTLKAKTVFVAVTVIGYLYSTTPMKRVSQASKSRLPKEQITEMAFNGAGVRDTARTLKVGINTVIRTLKNSHQSE